MHQYPAEQDPQVLPASESTPGVSRRSVVRGGALAVGAAWAAPAILSAVGTPLAAASPNDGVDNSVANYYFADHSTNQGELVRLDPPSGGGRWGIQYSMQSAYQSDPWVNPSGNGAIVFTITANQPITRSAPHAANWTQLLPADEGPATVFQFSIPLADPGAFWGPNLNLFFDASEYGLLSTVTQMHIIDGDRTWSNEPALGTIEVVESP